MIIVFGRPAARAGLYISPVHKHLNGLARWSDMLSHDASLTMTVIDAELDGEVVEAIRGDRDVFDVVDLAPEPPVPGPESGDSGERNPDRRISDAGFENAIRAAKRLGMPEEALNQDMTYGMIISALRERMLINQALGEEPPDAPLAAARKVRERLNRAGFDVEDETAQDIRETIERAIRKGAVRRGNPDQR